MARNKANRSRTNKPKSPVASPVEKTTVVNPVDSTPEVIGDTVTKQPYTPTEAPATPTPSEKAPLKAAKIIHSVTDPDPEDTEVIHDLKIKLIELKKALQVKGKTPDEFKATAKITASFVKYLIKHPKNTAFDLVLGFFEENRNGVCEAREFMKGSTTLPGNEEQQVGLVFNLFDSLASKKPMPINTGLVYQVLKKVEFANYYTRKATGLRARSKG